MPRLLGVTLADVARAAGLSTGGASYALRGHPSIPAGTVERVRQIAAKMNYRSDLRVSSLMATIRRGRMLAQPETLAFVWVNTPRKTDNLPIHLQHYVKVLVQAARQRAEQLGSGIEEFWLGQSGLTPHRLHSILRARGISGVLISPAAGNQCVAIDWDWQVLAPAIIGSTEISPVINRAAHYHFRSVWRTLERLRVEGRARPAAILSETVQGRIHRMQHAAFITHHPTPAIAHKAVRFCEPGEFRRLGRWLKSFRPDALLLGWQVDERILEQLRELAPQASRIVTLDWHPHGVLPGIDPCNEVIASNAVDLVIAQLHRNECGVAPLPTTVLLDGEWRETS
ncbi:MAG: LacI family DNA-binding transcriptional regulator [Opitutaceae bacterium]|nr:LacI family DNA-binding transcriptional regulator [Opitutaceae bacterium]